MTLSYRDRLPIQLGSDRRQRLSVAVPQGLGFVEIGGGVADRVDHQKGGGAQVLSAPLHLLFGVFEGGPEVLEVASEPVFPVGHGREA